MTFLLEMWVQSLLLFWLPLSLIPSHSSIDNSLWLLGSLSISCLIRGKGIVSKSSLSLHTQNFKLKKKLFQISFLNSFINAIFAWKLWVRERTQLHERWRRVGRGIKVVSSLYTPSFLAPILSLRSYYASCRLNFLHPRIAFIWFGDWGGTGRYVVLHLL